MARKAGLESKRDIVLRFLRDSLVRGRPRRDEGILVYDALQVAPSLAYTASGYLNLGLWADEADSDERACERLLAYAAERAELDAAERVLDVGFGTGAQDVFFAASSDARIAGVNLSASQTRAARSRIEALGLADRIELRCGDATRLEHPDASFDAVLCIEAAFHFAPRERFFEEAHRVLRPGGRLVLADILPSEAPHWGDRLFWWGFDRVFFAPRENRVSLTTYQEQLKACGFDVQLERLTDRVYAPFFRARARAYTWRPARAVSGLLARWFEWHSPCEYVVAVAEKPGDLASARGVGRPEPDAGASRREVGSR